MSSQGKRDESTSVDAAKAKEDAKVPSLHTDFSLGQFCSILIMKKVQSEKGNSFF